MLGAAADAAQLAQAAPWLAVGALALAAAAWVYRQTRRAITAASAESRRSAAAQGKRIGDLEKVAGLLDLRRRQVEWCLLDLGIDLPYWPADGPQQPRARRSWHEDAPPRDVDEDQADELGPDTMQRRVPVPPLDPAVAARHRRD